MTKRDESQTPAPKVSHDKDPSEEKSSNLLKHIEQAKEGAESNPDATKTPEKIKEGDLSKQKREY